jgi:DNA polymerase III epsilon subunit-like protein
MKILYFDTETTGTNPSKHEITQFAAIVEIDGVVKEEVNWRCQPTRWDAIDPEAIATTGVSIEELKKLQTPDKMFDDIYDLFGKYISKFDKADKFYPAGHNLQFDLEFLQAFWRQHGDKYGTGSYQNWRSLDSRIFANFLCAAGRLDVPDVKLSTLAKHYEIEINAHDALSDIRATRLVIRRMIGELYQGEEVL